MQPGGGMGGEDGCTHQGSPPAAGGRCRDREAPSHSPSLFSSSETSMSKKKTGDEQHQEDGLPEGALVEILSRVPYRSLCRFKCVSKPWLALCSAPDIRRRSPQTLSGFFYFGPRSVEFRNLSGGGGPPMVDPSLPFLRESYDGYIGVRQCCISLLLCQCWKSPPDEDASDYVVCNPATEKWTVLPRIILPDQTELHLRDLKHSAIFLGCDTTVPSRFVVFAALGRYSQEPTQAAIYSSQTGRWTSVHSKWDSRTNLLGYSRYVFLNGIMYLPAYYSSVATVDAEGKVWKRTQIPHISHHNTIASIGHSQGRLYAWLIDNLHNCQLYVWVLEDRDSGKWALKHTVNVLELFGRHCRKDIESYKMFAIHPERNLIFLTDGKKRTVSYDMDNQNVHVICTSGEFLGGLPYTPCFAE